MRAGAARLSLVLWTPPVLAMACALDLAGAARASTSPTAVACLVALVVAVGVLHGLFWELAFATLRPLSLRRAGLAWAAFAFGLAAWWSAELGAFARLGTARHGLAVWVLVAAALAAMLWAAVLVALQPASGGERGWLFRASARVRVPAALALFAVATACFEADRRVFVGLYPAGHLVLRLGCVWLASVALAVAVPTRAVARRYPLAVFVAAGCLGLALGEADPAALRALTLRPWPQLVIATSRGLTDLDLDGYSGVLAGGDCAPFDGRVSPGASEVPGNGVDDNCMLGDARAQSTRVETMARPAQPAPLDVVLITLDSLRADRVGVYCDACGARGLATTPELDAFARDATVFERAYTPGGWTSIAVSALMRGRYARRLRWTPVYETTRFRLVRAERRADLEVGERLTKMFPLPITDPHVALASWLALRGMHTVAVVDDEFSELLAPDSAVAPGFQVYREVDALPEARRGDRGTTDLALAELSRVPPGQRFFLWVHYFGPHSPSRRHPGVRFDGAGVEQAYEHEVRYVDRQLGRLLDALAARRSPTAIFVSADHGEEFIAGERHHGFSLREAVVRVPLIARVPGWDARRVAMPVSLVDLVPTICELTGTPAPGGLDGRSLVPVAKGGGSSERVLLSDTWQYDGMGRLIRNETAAVQGSVQVRYEPLRAGWTLVEDAGSSAPREAPISPTAALPGASALRQYLDSSLGAAPIVN